MPRLSERGRAAAAACTASTRLVVDEAGECCRAGVKVKGCEASLQLSLPSLMVQSLMMPLESSRRREGDERNKELRAGGGYEHSNVQAVVTCAAAPAVAAAVGANTEAIRFIAASVNAGAAVQV